MPNPLIKTTNLKVVYDINKAQETLALKGVDVEIFPKEFVAFFGPSGCGKSTLLHCIAGLEVPTSGKVMVADKDLTTLNNREISAYHRNEIGMIFQAYNLIPTLTVLENIALPQIFDNRSFKERYQRTYELLERFGIREQARKIPTQLSGGQQQRVGVARALINNPLILLADEPIGNLDSKSAAVVLDILNQLNQKENKTIILVTHDPEYLYYTHRVFYMRDGLIVNVVKNQQRKAIAPKTSEPTESTIAKRIKETSADVQARLLTAHFMEKYTEEEKIRFQGIVNRFLINAFDEETLENLLDQPYEKGGMGFYNFTAHKIANELAYFKDEIGELKQAKTQKRKKKIVLQEAIKVRKYLLASYQGSLNSREIIFLDKLLDKVLNKRMALKILKTFLILSQSKGGLGLRKRTASKWLDIIKIMLPKAE